MAPAPLSVVLVGPERPDAAAAIAAAGARVAAAIDWDAVEDAAHGDALVIAAVPEDLGHGELEQLASVIDAHGLDALVVCETGALDAVAAVLLVPGVTLLCEPGPSDWIAALALAGRRPATRASGVREDGGEAERLLRLHDEVARIAAQLSALAEQGRSEAQAVADRRNRYAAAPAEPVQVDPAEIRRVIRARRARAQFFDARLLEDPGWDMLLDLFAAELEGTQVSVSSLCIAAAVAPTTALRWITRMAEAGLMVRVPDAGDRRRAFVALSAHAGAAMRAYVDAQRKAGLPLV